MYEKWEKVIPKWVIWGTAKIIDSISETYDGLQLNRSHICEVDVTRTINCCMLQWYLDSLFLIHKFSKHHK